MKAKNQMKARIIFGVYFAATLILLLSCYCVQKPAVQQKEFPFTITYSYQGNTRTISDVYVGEYVRTAKYIGDEPTAWYGYIKDRNRLEADYYRIAEENGQTYAINLNIEPGFLMGDPRYADAVCQPNAVYQSSDGTNSIEVTDPAELEQMGFSIVGWEYPQPVANSFSFGGLSMSSEATMLTAALAVVALLACVFAIKRRRRAAYSVMDKVSIVLNFLLAIVAFPFILVASALSEIVADASALQQLLYLAPALTALGIAESVTMRRMGHMYVSFFVQFAGPAVFGLVLLLQSL